MMNQTQIEKLDAALAADKSSSSNLTFRTHPQMSNFIQSPNYSILCPPYTSHSNASIASPLYIGSTFGVSHPNFPFTYSFSPHCSQYRSFYPHYSTSCLPSSVSNKFSGITHSKQSFDENKLDTIARETYKPKPNKSFSKIAKEKLPSNRIVSKPHPQRKIEEDNSLQELDLSDDGTLPDGNYKYRNVYKSIIRRMNAYAARNKEKLTSVLLDKGFKKEDVQRAFTRLEHYNELERKKGFKKMSPKLVKCAASLPSPYSYILKGALEETMQEWKQMKHGKVIKKNLGTYKEVCERYYKKTMAMLEK